MNAATEAQHRLFVCWSMNDPTNEEVVRAFSAAIGRQRDIPGVLTIEDGPRTTQVDWEGPEDSFDYAMSMTFDNFDSVRAYPPHPIHQDLVTLILENGSNIKGYWMDV